MKRFISVILLLAVITATALAVTSCSQEEVDKMYEETKQTVSDLLAPFFKKFEGTTESTESVESTESTTDSNTADL